MVVFYNILGAILLEINQLYIWHKFLNKKIDFKNIRLYITFILLTIITLINFFLINKFIKITIITVIFMLFFKYLFKEKWHKCIIVPIFYQFIIMISEIIYALFLMLVFKSSSTDAIGTFIGNLSISLIAVVITQLKYIYSLYNYCIKLVEKIKDFRYIWLSLLIIIAIPIFPLAIYYKIEFKFLLIFCVLMLLICCAIIIYTLRTQVNFNEVTDKYNIAITTLKDYENMISNYRIYNHENKNLLLTIRAMIMNKEKDIPKYIDTIIENKFVDDEQLLFKINVIPSGGLRGVIYSEIIKIKEYGLKYSLNIDKNLNTVDLINADTDLIINVCKIIGVLMDNAIEETLKLPIKSQNIDISLYIAENKLNIKISNNYKTKFDLNKIDKPGYTTKEKGHGYGLTLINKIIESDKRLSKTTSISKHIFSQTLIIDYK